MRTLETGFVHVKPRAYSAYVQLKIQWGWLLLVLTTVLLEREQSRQSFYLLHTKKYHYQGSHSCTRENLESGKDIIKGVGIFIFPVVGYFPSIGMSALPLSVSLIKPHIKRGIALLHSFMTFYVLRIWNQFTITLNELIKAWKWSQTVLCL